MNEASEIIQLNIRRYEKLLKLNRHTLDTRQRVTELLQDARIRLLHAKDREAKLIGIL
jgi:hypothetical protein